MRKTQGVPVGIVLTSTINPNDIAQAARLVEQLGFSELWVAEDPYLNGGFAAAGIALAATERILVGLGLVSAVVRHPVITAMEIATLADAFPNRFVPAIGLGSQPHLRQMGLHPKSPLSAVSECVLTVRRLLKDGGRAETQADSLRMSSIELNRRVVHPPPLYMGATGPRMLQLSGEIADGTILCVMAPPRYVAWAREQIELGAHRVGRTGARAVPSFALFSMDSDPTRAKQLARADLAALLDYYGPQVVPGRSPLTDLAGASDLLIDMVKRGGASVIEREMPLSWLDDFVIAGHPDECAVKVRRYLEAGATSVILAPVPKEHLIAMIEMAGAELLPRLASG
jgi:5,10-methylenetetrahydromethanopterin reductase